MVRAALQLSDSNFKYYSWAPANWFFILLRKDNSEDSLISTLIENGERHQIMIYVSTQELVSKVQLML